MPNFGKLTKDLNGCTLTIGDTLVIDCHLNLHIGNVYGGNVFGTIFTNQLVEESSMQGIHVLGNLHISDGYYVTGNALLTNVTVLDALHCKSIIASATLLTIGGNTRVDGIFTVRDELLTPQIVTDTIVTEVVATNTITAKTGSQVEIIGNVRLIDPDACLYVDCLKSETFPGAQAPLLVGNVVITGPELIVPQVICSGINTNTIDVVNDVAIGGNVAIGGCINVAKSNSPGNNTNIVHTTTSAGHIVYHVVGSGVLPLEQRTITMINPCIVDTSSVVMGMVSGTYNGVGLPIMIRSNVFVSGGSADFTFFNFSGNTMAIGETVPIQYLIV